MSDPRQVCASGAASGGVPQSAVQAAELADAALGRLAAADAGSLTGAEQASCLKALEAAQARLTAARSGVLSAFSAQGTFEDDGAGSAAAWLRAQTRVTRAAAGAAAAWMRRLAAHPAVAEALAAGWLSQSWAREICDWTDPLPENARGPADEILLAAAAGGASLDDLAALAEEMRRRTAQPDTDSDDDGFGERRLRLDRHYQGAGKLDGDLTPACAEALQAVLDALGKRHGPEDDRSIAQRYHDALEEAMRRLIAAGLVPERAGQPTHIMLHMTLAELLQMAGQDHPGQAGTAEDSSGPSTAAAPQPDGAPDGSGESGWSNPVTGAPGSANPGDGPASADTGHAEDVLPPDPANARTGAGPAAPPGYACDATIIPVVTGRIDTDILDQIAARLLRPNIPAWLDARLHPGPAIPPALRRSGDGDNSPGYGTGGSGTVSSSSRGGGSLGQDPGEDRDRRATRAARSIVLRDAIRLLSGPGGLAAILRSGLAYHPARTVSLPLDIGAAADTIPAHLRRAVAVRDRGCRFPGCDQPPAASDVHHLVPRADGGPTRLDHLLMLCRFHHLIAVHRRGWQVTLHPDGTVTARSPDGRTLHSHGPPATAA
jgi:hypothetical protein